MDKEFHEEITKEAGERVLVPKLAKAGRSHHHDPAKPIRIDAFYLGNWLTDVSQAMGFLDLSATASEWLIAECVLPLQAVLDKLLADVPGWLPQSLIDDSFVDDLVLMGARAKLDRAIEETRAAVESVRDDLIETIRSLLGAERSSALGRGITEFVRFWGYTKFVLADDWTRSRMDEDSYFSIFEQRFTKYHAHEHLDRPGVSTQPGPPDEDGVPTKRVQYASDVEAGPQNKWLSTGRWRERYDRDRDVYDYLREHIRVAAGILSRLDGGSAAGHDSWAAATFGGHRTHFVDEHGESHPIRDDNPAWNLRLADLGHALHAAEDFFAHSTFLELASAALPRGYRTFSRAESAGLLQRRLKRWSIGHDPEQWRSLPDEPHVVTGYFDGTDTLISVLHILDHALLPQYSSPGRDLDHIREYDYMKLLRDALEFASDPKKAWSENEPDRDGELPPGANEAVRILRGTELGKDIHRIENGDDRLNRLASILLAHPPLSGLHPEAKKAFEDAVRLLGQGMGAASAQQTVFSGLTRIAGLFRSARANPGAFVVMLLGDYVAKPIIKQLAKYGATYSRYLAYRALGSQRIGSHSLIAKDHGQEVLFKAGLECAKAVDWYVCRTLTRHARTRSVRLGRGAGRSDVQEIADVEWIDWLELFEHFLANPLAYKAVHKRSFFEETVVTHVTRDDGSSMSPDSLENLAERYNPTRYADGGDTKPLTWCEIADANFPTERMSDDERCARINAVLRDREGRLRGQVVSDGINYAFHPGLELVIPRQRVEVFVDVGDVDDHTETWWYKVITEGFQAKRTQLDHVLRPLTHVELRAEVAKADELRIRLEGP